MTTNDAVAEADAQDADIAELTLPLKYDAVCAVVTNDAVCAVVT